MGEYIRREIELAADGTGYRALTRFAKFFNLSELMNDAVQYIHNSNITIILVI